jgi:hypothetical protein
MQRLIPLLCVFASPLWAEVGTVAQVEQGVIIRGDTINSAEAGDEIEQGDILQTDPSGLIHVTMTDNTRFVVGPNTTISIDTALIGSDETKFESLAVGVTAGVFRFLSGDSEKSAYGVDTPVATMGIRGTVFDLVHVIETDLVVLDGEVDFCTSDTNQCIVMEASCTTASTLEQEAKVNEDQALDDFSLLYNQRPILDDWKAGTDACGDRIPQEEAALAPAAPADSNGGGGDGGSTSDGGGGDGDGGSTANGGGGGTLAASATAAFATSGLANNSENGVFKVDVASPVK